MTLDVRPVVDWLIAGAPPARVPEDALAEFCRRARAVGLPLYRVAVFVRTLHPNVVGRSFIWVEGRESVETGEAAYDLLESEQFLKSPIRIVFAEHREVRRCLADPSCPIDFPVLDDLLKEGVTDFLALPLAFVNGEVHACSFATRQPGGFREAEAAALRAMAPALARLAEVYSLMARSRNILDAYLGSHAGEKVLAGQIRRGDGEELRAVIWFCDLRDSTALADSMSRADFLQLLNTFFECVLGPVLARQGQVLRFIGDAALAIFPVGGSPREACERALAAALEAQAAMDKLNATRALPLRFGIGLHLGEVLYGNVGTPSRIEFTVIGAAANEAARIEALCKDVGAPLIVSEAVARELGTPMCSIGRHHLRGVGETVELFTLAKKN
ncbi:MAG TPA: adenylate/guanylate cyclase domain-containing protein [Burkholderiales bacterium]|nr:adenylate/guanylate cyclase domain-containing protein [Burkholderiales bacterium]